MKQENNIGDLFREAFKDFERKPSDKIWNNIENNVKPNPIAKPDYFKPVNLFIGSGIIAVLLITYFLSKPVADNKSKTTTAVAVNAVEKTDQNIKNIDENKTNPSDNNVNQTIKTNSNTNSNNLSQPNKTKRININDLIAQADTRQNNTNETVNPISVSSISQKQHKNVDKQPLANNTVISAIKNAGEIKFSPDQNICKGEKVQLSVIGGVNFLWSTGEISQSINVSPAATTDYSVAAYDEAGNKKVGLITVNVTDCNKIFVPNAFTPNGDGESDVFKAYGTNITKFEIIIISRTGQIVFTSQNINEGWDGTYKGKALQEGVYVYNIKYTNELNKEQTVTGHITLIR
ncbi:MAG: gliding motility-associated C-terminal domain-containing protein [Bacteroidetes bacterium]|nr:gliding motility-associated C-terminal domain-containing protein [Bacteroidota bacterium]